MSRYNLKLMGFFLGVLLVSVRPQPSRRLHILKGKRFVCWLVLDQEAGLTSRPAISRPAGPRLYRESLALL